MACLCKLFRKQYGSFLR